MKEVLIITYCLPPRPFIGSNRLGGLAKYLGNYGWNPIFLTPELQTGEWDPSINVVETPFPFPASITKYREQVLPDIDKGYGQKLKQTAISAIRPAFKLLKEFKFYPDEYNTWIPVAIEYGSKVLKERKISAIISSSEPTSTHLIANRLSKDFGIPWIADFRDLWTQNHYYSHSKMRKSLEKRLETKTVKAASALVTVSQPLADKLQQIHPCPTYSIPNGFDPDEVRNDADVAGTTQKLLITYTGHMYEGKRDPTQLLEAISQLLAHGQLTRELIELRFYGSYSTKLDNKINEMGLKDIVIQYGMVDRETAIQRQRDSSVLLLLNWNDPAEEGVYTGKLFEYLAARRPILALGGPGGVVKELLDETEAGVHVNKLYRLQEVLLQWLDEIGRQGAIRYNANQEKVNNYSHLAMAGKFANLLNEYGK